MYNIKTLVYPSETHYIFYDNPVIVGKPKTIKKTSVDFVPNSKSILDFIELHKSPIVRSENSARSSLSRTKNKIFSYAMCNEWDYFCTITFSGAKCDRFDFSSVSKVFKSFIDNYRRKNPNFKYIFVPEKHVDGAFHFHGLVSNVSPVGISNSINLKIGSKFYGTHLKIKGHFVYDWIDFKLGGTSLTKVVSSSKSAVYLTKYITKDLCISDLKGKKKYWSSKNLNLPIAETAFITTDEYESLKLQLKKDLCQGRFLENTIKITHIPNYYQCVHYLIIPN